MLLYEKLYRIIDNLLHNTVTLTLFLTVYSNDILMVEKLVRREGIVLNSNICEN